MAREYLLLSIYTTYTNNSVPEPILSWHQVQHVGVKQRDFSTNYNFSVLLLLLLILLLPTLQSLSSQLSTTRAAIRQRHFCRQISSLYSSILYFNISAVTYNIRGKYLQC